ncbi:hypothetical protein DAPPUDRAFT_251247 [Daphnia pulex]|uniref:Transposase Tc1-like domain-containing protein n=1 Tax=Daphnia pulex TaxID=6669 RepID=E9H009_DAPPU|nr:hypothetical protein DAPPUDRAFT_251247 [Daphnia pulex]|eukprot:EFX74969.1 hypothetical protein DAPPUDRAFT_251247 [Daphnia pulex]
MDASDSEEDIAIDPAVLALSRGIPVENNFDNSADVAFKAGIDNLHTSTINRRLIEAGLKSKIAAVKDILTDEHRAGRLAFARRSGRTSVSVWGGMWSGGLTRLSRVEGNLTAVQYFTNSYGKPHTDLACINSKSRCA